MSVIATRTTAPGRGAIAVVEVVGEGASALVAPLFSGKLTASPSFGRLEDDGPVDEVVVRKVPAEKSFTGLETIEVCCHGGEVVVERVLRTLARHGAEVVPAERLIDLAPLDEVQKEAWRLLPNALTGLAARMLLDQARGALSRAVREGRKVLGTAALGQALVTPRRIVLAGPPNAGKSTLFNALAEQDRVIVSNVAGTTRDPVSEFIAIRGVPFLLCDTAGTGEERTRLETMSSRRAQEEKEGADLVLDLSGKGPLAVTNKIDLGRAGPGIRISAKTGEGLDELRAAVLAALGIEPELEPGAPVVFTKRQERALKEGKDIFSREPDPPGHV